MFPARKGLTSPKATRDNVRENSTALGWFSWFSWFGCSAYTAQPWSSPGFRSVPSPSSALVYGLQNICCKGSLPRRFCLGGKTVSFQKVSDHFFTGEPAPHLIRRRNHFPRSGLKSIRSHSSLRELPETRAAPFRSRRSTRCEHGNCARGTRERQQAAQEFLVLPKSR